MRTTEIDWTETRAPNARAASLDGAFRLAAHRAFAALPAGAAATLAGRLAMLARRKSRGKPFERRMAATLATLRPDLASEADRAAFLDGWWRAMGLMHADYAQQERIRASGRLSVEGAHNLDAARATGRPIILTMVHTGSWELVFGFAASVFDGAVTGSWQPQRSAAENRIVADERRRAGFKALPPGPNLARTLHLAHVTGALNLVMFVDEVSEGGIKFPLFGRPVPQRCNLTFSLKLAAKTGAALLPAHIVRRPANRFALTLLPPLDGGAFAGPGGLARGVHALNAVYEPHVLAHLGEWYMLHALRLT